MMTPLPTVSAVIPVYNGEAYVSDAIRSVLEQSQPAIECIVVDDGSTDGTAEAVHQFGTDVRYVVQENSGVSMARNRGAGEAHGDLVAFLDHDDVWEPTKIAAQVAVLTAEPATLALCAMTITDARGIAMGERHLRPRTDLRIGMLTFDGTEIPSCSSTGVIWKSDFDRLGGFDPGLGTSADWDLLFRVLLRGRLAYVDEPLTRYRVHGSNMSRNVASTERDMLVAYGKVFADPQLPEHLRKLRRPAYAHLFRMLSGSYRDAGDLSSAIRTAFASLSHDPTALADMLFQRLRGRVAQ